jgi:hypothetical protein
MMGRRDVAQDKFFYGFNLSDHVPREHLLRGIDRYFDLGDLTLPPKTGSLAE